MMQHTKTHIDNKKSKTRGRKRKQKRPAHEPPSTSEIDSTTPPVVDGFRARRGLSIQELCHPSNEEIMVSAARYFSRSDHQAIGVLVFMSREA
jgi:ribosome-binding protein aMBF1 (putative translation factor)